MKGKTVSWIILTLLLISIKVFSVVNQPVEAQSIIIVPDNYRTIQEAINHANEGDTIYVRAGTYDGNVVVNKTVSLIGENKFNTTIIFGEKVVSITAHNVRICDFAICLGETGISIYSANNVTINDCIIVGNSLVGIAIEDSHGNIIANNRMDWNRLAGISLYLSHNNIIVQNTISNTTAYRSSCGIATFYSNNSMIYHNSFINTIWAPNGFLESFNKWDNDYPSGGNYWDQYIGADMYSGPYQNETGSDGIGDTPHRVVAENYDRYPLMNPWTGTHIVDVPISGGAKATLESNVTITKALATRNGLHFETSGPSGSTGWINVTFPMINITEINVFIDTEKLAPPPFPILTTNGTHYFIYFEFALSMHETRILMAKLGDLGGGIPPEFFAFDNVVDGMDLALFIQCYKGLVSSEAMGLADLGRGLPPQFLNCDGKVDGIDLALFIQCYKGQGPDT